MNKLTLEEIGKKAGVSRSTVSRVINGHPNVKDAVRERVLAVIKETDFHPHPAARSLASQKSNSLALIVPPTVDFIFSDVFLSFVIQDISRVCNLKDYLLSLFLFQTPTEEAKLRPRILSSKQFDGAIVVSHRSGESLVTELVQKKVPFVLNGRHDHPDVNFVDVDNISGAYMAVDHLIKLGHQRIATITGPRNSLAAVDRTQGYLNALGDHGLTLNEALIIPGDYTEKGGYEATQRLLSHNPSALFVASDRMSFGVLQALGERGLNVPDDIALVSFDDVPQAMNASPPLTTVRQPMRQIGPLAVETLLDLLDDPDKPVQRLVLPTELIVRDSCGAGDR